MATNIQSTKNHKQFKQGVNRHIDISKHRALRESMKRYGFIKSFPIIVSRNGGSQFVIKDGQHRWAIAEELGLPVHFVIDDTDFDVAEINCTSKSWGLIDYVMRYAEAGNKHYQDLLEFSQAHKMPLSISASIMRDNTTRAGRVSDEVRSGQFVVKNREFADTVASLYRTMCLKCKDLQGQNFAMACAAVCRVPDFDPGRLISNAERCREKLVSYATRDAILGMFEEIYNHGRVKLVGLKAAALMELRERSATAIERQ